MLCNGGSRAAARTAGWRDWPGGDGCVKPACPCSVAVTRARMKQAMGESRLTDLPAAGWQLQLRGHQDGHCDILCPNRSSRPAARIQLARDESMARVAETADAGWASPASVHCW